MVRTLRVTGWTLVGSGVVVLLYVVYLLFFTTFLTGQSQREMLDAWSVDGGDPTVSLPAEGLDDDGEPAGDGDEVTGEVGDGYALLWFERDGERIIHDEPLVVVDGVELDDLRRGPGHYPDTAAPGEDGNTAISGHRTTYGAPFYDLDDLESGDEIHVADRDGQRWVYEVVEQRIVAPSDVWVIDEDPRGTGEPLLTLATCHPRFSAAERLIVWAELRES